MANYSIEKLKGKLLHLAKSLNSITDEERIKFANLAGTYNLEDKEKELVEILKRKDFSMTNILKEMGREWEFFCMELANRGEKEILDSNMIDYMKRR